LYQLVNLNQPATAQPTVTGQRIPIYVCPSEVNDMQRAGTPPRYPMSYGANEGGWMVLDPTTGKSGDGAFPFNKGLRATDFPDGMTNTIGFAEVKTYQEYLLSNSNPLSDLLDPPVDASAVVALGGTLKQNAHTGWTVGQTFQTGVTFVLPPNTVVPFTDSAGMHDVDWISVRDGSSSSQVSYAAVMSRSYHSNLVNVFLMDGSVRSVASNINRTVWRALGTRAGSEVVPANY